MPNYNNSFIYKICCKDTSIEDIYIGSTINFRNRKWLHKSNCNSNNTNSHFKVYQFIRENGGWDNWDMILVENVNVNSKLELHKKEREYIDLLKPSLNCKRPIITEKERKELKKKYEVNTEKRKEYYIKNKKIIAQKFLNNKESILKQQKEYREKNKELIKQKASKKINCECGGIYRHADRSKHFKTKKHQTYLTNLQCFPINS